LTDLYQAVKPARGIITKDFGGWESLEMLPRYTRSVTFQDSLKFWRLFINILSRRRDKLPYQLYEPLEVIFFSHSLHTKAALGAPKFKSIGLVVKLYQKYMVCLTEWAVPYCWQTYSLQNCLAVSVKAVVVTYPDNIPYCTWLSRLLRYT
jgi:hypothetical protein